MPGGRGPLAVLGRCHQEAPRRLVNHRHLPFANRFIAMLHASGAASTLQRRGIPHTRHSCECASVPPDPKAHFCDRHHIASAMAELVFCSSIIPHMRSFDVPPKLEPAVPPYRRPGMPLHRRNATTKRSQTENCRKSPAAAHPRATTRRGISWEKGS